MSTSAEATQTNETSSIGGVASRVRHYLFGRVGLILVAATVVGAGLILNWSWLVAIGVAPVLLAVGPCIAMCALGMCMNKMAGKSCSKESESATPRKEIETANEMSSS